MIRLYSGGGCVVVVVTSVTSCSLAPCGDCIFGIQTICDADEVAGGDFSLTLPCVEFCCFALLAGSSKHSVFASPLYCKCAYGPAHRSTADTDTKFKSSAGDSRKRENKKRRKRQKYIANQTIKRKKKVILKLKTNKTEIMNSEPTNERTTPKMMGRNREKCRQNVQAEWRGKRSWRT